MEVFALKHTSSLDMLFKALSDKTRLEILTLLRQGERCGCDLIHHLTITQPTLSHHLRILSEAGLISGVRHGNRVDYVVTLKTFETMIQQLDTILNPNPTCEVTP